MSNLTRRGTRRPSSLYAVFDAFSKKLSANMPYAKARAARKRIGSLSEVGGLQAAVATPPFKVRRV